MVSSIALAKEDLNLELWMAGHLFIEKDVGFENKRIIREKIVFPYRRKASSLQKEEESEPEVSNREKP